ncbi:MAG TPA: EAL domain-containing protein [Thermoanaerobaculia bacterium]|nr:EAL domain-containing protein [Thermoanaerobaculia bacterium]
MQNRETGKERAGDSHKDQENAEHPGEEPSAESRGRLEAVNVPEPFAPIFLRAQQHVASYFADRVEDPTHSTILISGERYILVRAASMSVEFFNLVTSLYRDRGPEEARGVANNLLFDIAHAIGRADARSFHSRMKAADPIDKLSTGPIHFSYSGWAFVKIFAESNPSPDESYYLIYDHPFSFESDAWLRRGQRSETPVCIMSAGYSSGWCEESFGLPLVAAEVECLAAGGEHCRFIMAPPSRIEEHLERYGRERGRASANQRVSDAPISVPEFFQRKRMEDELRRSRDDLEVNVQERTAELSATNERLRQEIAERLQFESQLRLFESAVQNAIEGIVLLSAEKQPSILFVNAGFEKLTGYSSEHAVGQPLTLLCIDETERDVLDRLQTHLETERPFEGEASASRQDGTPYVLEMHVMPVRDRTDRLTHWVCILRDVSDRKAHLAELQRQALHDVLTDLPNRVLLLDRLGQAILSATRQGESLALVIMDLDRFKEVNDTFGHHMGDQLLMQVGPRLRNQIRASDTVARLGGDEFAILLPTIPNIEAAVATGRKLLRALEVPFIVEDHAFEIGASIGIAIAPDHGNDPTTLLRRADVAMYVAKQSNSGCAVYSPEQDRNSPTRLALVSDLRQAMDLRQLVLHYQPKIDVKSGVCKRFEALVRWNHPRHGLMLPDQFVPLAERTGLIGPLTAWVLNEALAECKRWHDRGLAADVAVNLSGRSLHDPALVTLIEEAIARWRVEPKSLKLELTESSIMADPGHVMRVLERLGAMNVRLSIDDFGTGYSSLSHLRLLPVDEIKIDKSFVIDMLKSPSDEAIVRSTIQLCHNLGRKVVAEGVENEATLIRLRELGCDLAQGFHIARPMPGSEVAEWMKGR